MAHFAKVKNGIVTKVLVADQDFIDNYIDHEPGRWVQTSYNTQAGEHKLGGTPLRKNFARVGYIYDAGKDAFYEPQPYPSWTLNEDTCSWSCPVEYPNNEDRTIKYIWNETNQSWDEVT